MKEQFIVDDQGRRTAVGLALRDYQRLLEDLHDLRIAAERRDEPTISLTDLKARLEQDGSVPDRI